MSVSAIWRDDQRSILDAQAHRAFAAASSIRVVAMALFWPFTVALWLNGDRAWSPLVGPLTLFFAATALVHAFRNRDWLQPYGAYTFVIDIGLVYVTLVAAADHSQRPPFVAGFASGVFGLTVALCAFSMQRRATVVVTAAACAAQVALMTHVGIRSTGQFAAVVTLLLTAYALSTLATRLRRTVLSLAVTDAARLSEAARADSVAEANRMIERLLNEATQVNERLASLQKDKDVLTALLVHDLRAPLSSVRSTLNWVHGELPAECDPEVRAALSESKHVADRLSSMIGDMLNISRLEQSSLPLDMTAVSPRDLLTAIQKQTQAEAKWRNVTVQLHLQDGVLYGDRALLTRTLENLVSNALRYTPASGRILLECRFDSGEAMVAIRNDGNPIPPDVRATVFEKFVQNGSTTADNRRAGWGLGLYFCKLSLEAHGGHIFIDDAPGWGTSFVIKLPVHRSAIMRVA